MSHVAAPDNLGGFEMAVKNRVHAGANGRATMKDIVTEVKKAKEKEPGGKRINIPKLEILHLQIEVRGITPLLICKFDEKVKREMEEKTEGKAKNAKAPKDPEAEWNAARHVSEDGKWDGIHAGGIRAAMIDAARLVDGLTMTELKQMIFVEPDGYGKDGSPLVRINGVAEKHSGMCRTTTGVSYPRHRPIYREWSATIRISAAGGVLTAEQVVNLLSIAGFTCGVGEWRPTSPKSKTGSMGRWEVVTGSEDTTD